jgi:hypothetical protein
MHCRLLGLSQPAFSRMVTQLSAQILAVGQARARCYALRRNIVGVGHSVLIYQIDTEGGAKPLATLHGVEPKGYYVESHTQSCTSRLYDDLPWFLHDLRPSGFLGRLVPSWHPELRLPPDLRLWTADQCLLYLSRYGWNVSGALLVGEVAYRLYQAACAAPPDAVRQAQRKSAYARLADDVLQLGAGGDRMFLEVERLDRCAGGGRRGVCSLEAIDCEFVGDLTCWVRTSEKLLAQRLISHGTHLEILWRSLFGSLIANNDMHHGNLSVFTDGTKLLGLTPVYDMLPMLYAPRAGQLIDQAFAPPRPLPEQAALWDDARQAAVALWHRVQKHRLVSTAFQKIAAANARHLNCAANTHQRPN